MYVGVRNKAAVGVRKNIDVDVSKIVELIFNFSEEYRFFTR
jgi:hypothetical protein